ncbi:MAG: glycosyltransferase [Firmicutes bacterium]|nr:glycosyltransferase [Bacillota bacterium]
MTIENRKLNIALFSDAFLPYIDGVVMAVDNYAKHLDNIGKVYVICPRPTDKKYKYDRPYEIINCKAIRLPILRIDYPRPKRDKEFFKKLEELDLDIIHIHSPFAMGAIGVKLAKKKNIPVVATLHSQFKRDFKRFARLNFIVKILLKKIMATFNEACEVWTFNSGCKNTLYEYGYKGKCHLVSNGTDMEPIADIDEHVKKINEEYGLTEVKHVFIFVGRLYKAKNNGFSLKALRILKEKGFNDFKFVIVGEGEDLKNLKKLTRKYDIENNVVFTGIIKDRTKLAGLLKRADLFLFPSLYDMSSLVQIEAACYKTPVIFLEGANTATAVTHDVNGFISPNNVVKYADLIETAVKCEEKLKEIGNNAHRDLYITWRQLSNGIYNRYLEIVNSKIKS